MERCKTTSIQEMENPELAKKGGPRMKTVTIGREVFEGRVVVELVGADGEIVCLASDLNPALILVLGGYTEMEQKIKDVRLEEKKTKRKIAKGNGWWIGTGPGPARLIK